MMKISDQGTDLLIKLEGGLKTEAYLDEAGIPTISIGVTRYQNGTPVKMGDTTTEKEAFLLFRRTLDHFNFFVDQLLPDDLPQTWFDTCVIFAYNIGIEAFRTSTFRRKLIAKAPIREIAKALFLFIKIRDGETKKLRVSAGLVNRRVEELLYYLHL
jgi:lysozyme